MNKIFFNTWQILTIAERRKFIFLTAGSILISLADILSLVALLWIVHYYITPDASVPDILPSWLSDRNSVALIGIFLGWFAFKNIAGYLLTRVQDIYCAGVATRISRNNLAKFQQSGFMEFVNTDSSVLIRRIALEPFEFTQHVLSGLQQILAQVFLVSISIIAILAFDARLFIFLFVILLPPAILVFYLLKKRISAARAEIKKENESSYAHLLDALKGYVESNIFGKNLFFLERFMQHRRSFAKELYRSLSLQQFPTRAIEIFAVLGFFILIILAKSQSGANTDLLLIIGAFIAASFKIIPGIVKIINLGGLVRAYKFNPGDLAGAGSIQKNNSLKLSIDSISLENIYFSYGEHQIIKELSLQAQKGEFIGISGMSGKGKTTLMNIILGFLSPSAGKIRINEEVMITGEIKKYWPSFSYVKQQPFLINDTLTRNITLEETVSDPYALSRAIQMTGIGSMMKDYHENSEKIITENGKNISGGQQQRIAIARAFYNKADLFILDEPFNELDEASSLLIMEELAGMAGAGKIILLITHDKKILSLCHKIISLDGAVIKNLAGA